MADEVKIGRPSKYKDAYCNELIAAGQEGLSLTAFAGMIGVCRDTVNEWGRVHPEFSDAIKRHQAKRTEYLERSLLSADQGPRVTARIFALKNADPEGWKDRQLLGSDPENPLPETQYVVMLRKAGDGEAN